MPNSPLKTMQDDKKRMAALKRRVNKARVFPTTTCPASRHLHIMADCLAGGRVYHMFTDEPEHCAESIYAVLASLWEDRAKLQKLEGWEWCAAKPYLLDTKDKVRWANKIDAAGRRWKLGDHCLYRPSA